MNDLNLEVFESLPIEEGSKIFLGLELVQRLIDRDFPNANRADKDLVRSVGDSSLALLGCLLPYVSHPEQYVGVLAADASFHDFKSLYQFHWGLVKIILHFNLALVPTW